MAKPVGATTLTSREFSAFSLDCSSHMLGENAEESPRIAPPSGNRSGNGPSHQDTRWAFAPRGVATPSVPPGKEIFRGAFGSLMPLYGPKRLYNRRMSDEPTPSLSEVKCASLRDRGYEVGDYPQLSAPKKFEEKEAHRARAPVPRKARHARYPAGLAQDGPRRSAGPGLGLADADPDERSDGAPAPPTEARVRLRGSRRGSADPAGGGARGDQLRLVHQDES